MICFAVAASLSIWTEKEHIGFQTKQTKQKTLFSHMLLLYEKSIGG